MHPWAFYLTVFALLIGVAGLILTVLEFQARPTASLDTPLDATDVFSTPLVISNDGYLALNEVGAIWYIRDVRYVNGGHFYQNAAPGFVPESPVLEAGEHKTIAYPRQLVKGLQPISVDIVAAIYFKPAFWPFGKRHKMFRLLSVRLPDGGLRLQLQPAAEVAAEAERMLP